VELALKVDSVVLNIKPENTPQGDDLTGLAGYLFRDELLSAETARAAIDAAGQQGMPLTRYLVKSGILTSETLLACCVKNFGLPVFEANHIDFACLQDPILKPELIYRYRVIPIGHDQQSLQLAITDPTDHATMMAVGFHTGLRIRPILIAETELDTIINMHYRPNNLDLQLESALAKITPAEELVSSQENPAQDEEPIIEFVDHLIREAIDNHVSDIHIEPYEYHCRVRFRRDGLLYEATIIPPHLASRVTTRLKILANLNIAERRLPQDGRIALQTSSKVDIRVNTCPTLFGEKIVLRILDVKSINLDMNLLGLTITQKKLFLATLSRPQGLILVTGPTGSGKTITLYSALHHLNRMEKNISSVEDPIEIELAGINQVNINPKINLGFADVLRSFLRQDPDIIMIGEIRDIDTATIAIQAAQTGHLVLSTLHTNSAIETITRLQSMGMTTYHLMVTLSLIIAQRLVRKLCPHCKQPEILPGELRDQFKHRPPPVTYRPIGCNHCHQGYQGRIGIFELMPVTEKMAELIMAGANVPQILEQIHKEDLVLLWDAGLEKVREGVTSMNEVMRMVGVPSGQPEK
jgi:type IV pilus assembly protein PilB